MTAAEFAKLADAATPGPWRWNAQREMESATALSDAEFDSEPYPEKIIITDGGYYPPRTADAAFIAACGTERQRIHRALLLYEIVERYSGQPNPLGREAKGFLAQVEIELSEKDTSHGNVVGNSTNRLDAASKEMEARL